MPTPDELFSQAVQAARNGDRVTARSLLGDLVRQSPREGRAWYLLSQVVEQPERARFCLQKVLEIDPSNAKARQRLEALEAGEWAPGGASASASAPPTSGPPISGPPTSAPAKSTLPPWLADAEVNIPLGPAPGAPFNSEPIPSFPSTYVPPSIPGAVEAPASAPKPSSKFSQKPLPVKTKQKRDFFGIIVIGVTLLVTCCICGYGAFIYGGGQFARQLPGAPAEFPADFAAPEGGIYKLTYRLEGSGTAQVTYFNNQSKQVSKKVYLPWSASMEMPGGSIAIVSAQLLDSRKPFSCAIEIDGRPWKRNTSTGVVSCSGFLR